MKILKKGRRQDGWSGKYKCTGEKNGGGGCGSMLFVSELDVYQTMLQSYDDKEYCTTFRCIYCGVETDIKNYTGPNRHTLPTKQQWEELKKKRTVSTLWTSEEFLTDIGKNIKKIGRVELEECVVCLCKEVERLKKFEELQK